MKRMSVKQHKKLIKRAVAVSYKPRIPKLPKEKQGHNGATWVGFWKRLSNWKTGLLTKEQPNGILTRN